MNFPFRFPVLSVVVASTCLGLVPLAADLTHRQSELTVSVRNLADAPLEGAVVSVEMINPAFRFGTAIVAGELQPGSAEYTAAGIAALKTYFNSVTFGNFHKWSYFESRPLSQTLATMNQAFALGSFGSSEPMGMRGHTTIWGAQYQLPSDFQAMTDPAQVKQRLRNHARDYHTALAGKGIVNYDLYNEPFHERAFVIEKAVPGGTVAQQAAEIAEWFKAGQLADPTAKLYINEYNILNFWQENDADVIAYKQLVDAIRDAGGPVGGIGLQAHMDRLITKEQITRRLNILAAPMAPTTNYPNGLPGLPIEITELDININNWNATPAQQAQVTANVLDAAFEHPSVEGVTMWGMRDSIHWRSNAILFDDSNPDNWVVKPSGQAWIDRVKGTWWTNTGGLSGGTGDYTATVFKGRHKVTVTLNGNTQEFIRDIAADDTLTVTFDDTPIDTSNSFLYNLSVRTELAAQQKLTIGFVVAGGAKDLLLRAGGPTLAQWALIGMPDPRMEVFAPGGISIAENDDWDAAALRDTSIAVGAFAYVEGSTDSALLLNANGDNTAEIQGDEAGAVLVEAFDTAAGIGPRLVNISARNLTGPGSGILTAGFVVGGTGHTRVLIRGIGPQLSQWGVPGLLADPKIQVFNGDGTMVLAENDNWDSSLAGVFDTAGAFELTPGSDDAALVVVLPADGNLYTVQVTGADGGTGVALVEVYELH